MKNWEPLTRGGLKNWAVRDRTNAGVAPTITTTSLPGGALGMSYDVQLAATGDIPLTWTYSGALPSGLVMSQQGRITGVPAAPVNASVVFSATNGSGTSIKTLMLHVANEGSGKMIPWPTTVFLLPSSVEVSVGQSSDLQVTVQDQDGDPIPNIFGVVSSTDALVSDAAQLSVTDVNGQATVRVTGISGGTASIGVTFDNVPSPIAEVTAVTQMMTKKLFVSGLDEDSYGDTGVSGVVFAMPASGRLVGAIIGEFSGKTIDSTGSLKVDAAEFNGTSLAVGSNVLVYMESAEEFAPLTEAEIIQE